MKFSDKPVFTGGQKKIISSIIAKFKEHYKNDDKRRIINFSGIETICSDEERKFIKYFLSLNPGDFGFNGVFLGITAVPNNLVMIKGQKITAETASLDDDGEKGVIPPQFLPENIYQAYKSLNRAIFKEVGKHLKIESGYRSPGLVSMALRQNKPWI